MRTLTGCGTQAAELGCLEQREVAALEPLWPGHGSALGGSWVPRRPAVGSGRHAEGLLPPAQPVSKQPEKKSGEKDGIHTKVNALRFEVIR